MCLNAATSMSTPRVTSAPTCWTPSLVKPVRLRDVIELEAVVHAGVDHLVAERVELRSHLADFGHDELFVRATTIGARILAAAFREDLESSSCRKRHAFGQYTPQLEDFAGLDEASGAKNGLGLHVIARAALVARRPTSTDSAGCRRGGCQD